MELAPYLQQSFGNDIRIDYGTGRHPPSPCHVKLLSVISTVDLLFRAQTGLEGIAPAINCSGLQPEDVPLKD